ncbi:50S ribosomal protein L25 [Buchnera aphidicola (Phyllaphis fagi)]|uniref:50S ribosomal protein L25 n=1 Tax=Buchnera aphidicola TaxID=9 RepID=UPI0034642468
MFVIHGIERVNKGTNYSRRLRKIDNKIPCIIYGSKKPIMYVELDHDVVFNMQKDSKFYNSNIILKINKSEYIVTIKEIQRHCFKLKLLHIDFLYIK